MKKYEIEDKLHRVKTDLDYHQIVEHSTVREKMEMVKALHVKVDGISGSMMKEFDLLRNLVYALADHLGVRFEGNAPTNPVVCVKKGKKTPVQRHLDQRDWGKL